MGFEDGEIDLGDLSYQQTCKIAANGWDVHLAGILFNTIYEFHREN